MLLPRANYIRKELRMVMDIQIAGIWCLAAKINGASPLLIDNIGCTVYTTDIPDELVRENDMAYKATKVTISLPREILSMADEVAAEKKISRSKVIYQCLLDMANARKRTKMIEGYRALAKDHLEFAKLSTDLANEVLDKE